MDGLHALLVLLLGVVSSSHDQTSGSVLEVNVRPGDNITLHCDCQLSTGVYIVWYRNCSHRNQPTLALHYYQRDIHLQNQYDNQNMNPSYNFKLVRNDSTLTLDLLIMNVTDLEEGLYYCGTEESVVEDKEHIITRNVYKFGNITTRITITTTDFQHFLPEDHETPSDCSVYYRLLVTLCPTVAVLSSLLSSLVVYHICCRKAEDAQAQPTITDERLNMDEDVCYAALEIREASQRPGRKKSESPDDSVYSATVSEM